MFEAPIPGESLTGEPNGKPWERPVEISDPKEALELHLQRLSDPKRAKGIAQLLEVGIDIQTLTDGILRSAVAQGVHSVDTSLAVAPVIHEHIKGIAAAAGIDAPDGFEDEEDEAEKENFIKNLRLKKLLKKHGEEVLTRQAPQKEEVPMEEPPVRKGLVARRQT